VWREVSVVARGERGSVTAAAGFSSSRAGRGGRADVDHAHAGAGAIVGNDLVARLLVAVALRSTGVALLAGVASVAPAKLRSSRFLASSEEILTGAALARRKEVLVMGLKVAVVARREWRAVASSVGFTSSRVGVVRRTGLAGTPSRRPVALKVIRVARSQGGLVALLVEATGWVSGCRGDVVIDTFAFGRGVVASEVLGSETVVASIAVGTGAVPASQCWGSDAEFVGALVLVGKSSTPAKALVLLEMPRDDAAKA